VADLPDIPHAGDADGFSGGGFVPEDADAANLETDDRFPSGTWVGYYIQWGNRGEQEQLLTFRDGVISGAGSDPAGDFGIRGTYDLDSGRVTLVKRYATYRVDYEGAALRGGPPGIRGGWTIRSELGFFDHGIFHIWPKGEGANASEHLEAEVPVGRTR
jgi:hypothetical protein